MTESNKILNYYECGEFLDLTGGTVRPGGIELTARAAELSGLAAGQRLLDAGCGTGISVEFLGTDLGIEAVGIDQSDEMIRTGLERNPAIRINKGTAEHLSFTDSSFDAVLSECCFSHFDDKHAALTEFHRVLAENGTLIMSDIFVKKRKQDVSAETGSFMDKETILDYINNTGFNLIIWEEHTKKLTQLLIDIVMKYGSMEGFLKQGNDSCGLEQAMKGAKLGYYLLIAEKQK